MEGLKTPHEKLVQYVKKNIAKGYPIDTLKYALLSQGYGRTTVSNAIQDATKQDTKQKQDQQSEQQTKDKNKPKITYTVVDREDQGLENYNQEEPSQTVIIDEEQGTLKKMWDKIWE